MKANQTQKRSRLSVDLEAYPDVARMLARAQAEKPEADRTFFVVDALRGYLISKGYGRKKDVAA